MTPTVYFTEDIPKTLVNKIVSLGFSPCFDAKKNSTVQGIIIRSSPKITPDFLALFPSLRFIGRFGSGTEHIDKKVCKEKNISILNAPGGNAYAVAEFCLGQLITLARNALISHEEILQGQWKRDENRGDELRNLTVGIIGFGKTGQEFGKLLHSFGTKVLAYDINQTVFNEKQSFQASVSDIQNQCTIISFHVPYTEKTHHFFSEEFLHKMKHPFYLLNASRGNVVNETTVLKGLKTKKIKGAALDVFSFEEQGFSKIDTSSSLFQRLTNCSENLLLSGHIAGLSKQSKERTEVILYTSIKNFSEKYSLI